MPPPAISHLGVHQISFRSAQSVSRPSGDRSIFERVDTQCATAESRADQPDDGRLIGKDAHDPRLQVPGWYGLFMTLPVYMVGLILVIPVVRNRTKGQIQSTALAIPGFIFLGWMLSHVGFLANSRYAYGCLIS